MRIIILLMFLVPASALLAWDQYPGSEKEIISSNPVEAAKISIEKGDLSLIIVADCFMGMPGYKGNKPPEVRPRVVGRTCEEMLGTERTQNVGALKEWAQQYNVYVQQHNNALKPTQ